MKWSVLSCWPRCFKSRSELPSKYYGSDAVQLEIEQIKKDIVLANTFLGVSQGRHEKTGGEKYETNKEI